MSHSFSSIAGQLRALGLRRGTLVMVHASLKKIGPIDGGAEVLLDALIDVVGSEGTILMILGASEREAFVASRTPAMEEIGVLAEVFRCRDDTIVNDHAAARFGATGSRASELLEATPLHDYYGRGSILDRFTRFGGEVLRLGANIDTVTLTHFAEYLADVPAKRRVRLRYKRADIGEQWIESLDDTYGIVDWPDGDYFSQILIDFLAAGKASVGPVGDSVAELFRAKEFVSFAVEWMETNL